MLDAEERGDPDFAVDNVDGWRMHLAAERQALINAYEGSTRQDRRTGAGGGGGMTSTRSSCTGTTPSGEEQGDEDLDAERSVQGEEDEYEEGARGEEGEDVEEEVHQEGEEVPGKAIWIHGPASLPDAPRTKNDKLVVYLEKPEALGHDFYKVSADTDQREATCVLQLVAKKNLKDIFYHARNLAISHYYAKKGKRRNKDRVIVENVTIEDVAGWERICPKWCLNKKDGWSALVAANGGQEIPEIQVWQAAHKKKDLVGGEVAYYGKVTESVKNYTEAFKKLHGEDSDPLSQPLDETAVMISGGGKPHGRTSILNAVHKPTIALPRIRHITSSSGVCMPPHPWRSTQTSDDARWEEAYEQLHAEFQQKMQEYEEAAMAARRHKSEQTKVNCCPF
ncbi:hypothetical protein ACQ4PT_035229 [Festuca glaucescens]